MRKLLFLLLLPLLNWGQCYNDVEVGATNTTYNYNGEVISSASGRMWTADGSLETTLDRDWPQYDSFRRVSGFGVDVSVQFLEPHSPRWELNGERLFVGDELIFPDGSIREISSVSTTNINNNIRRTYAINPVWTGQFTSDNSCIRVRRQPTFTVSQITYLHPYDTDVAWNSTVTSCDDCEIRRRFNNGRWHTFGANVSNSTFNINIARGIGVRPGAINNYKFALFRDGNIIPETETRGMAFRMEPEFRNVRIDGSRRSNRLVEFEPDADIWVRYDVPVLQGNESIVGAMGDGRDDYTAAGVYTTNDDDARTGIYRFKGSNYRLGNKNIRLAVHNVISPSISAVIYEKNNVTGLTITPEFTATQTKRIVGPYDFKWPQLRVSGVPGGYIPWASDPVDQPDIKLSDIVGRSWIAEVTFYDDDGRYGGGCNDRTTQIGWRLQYRNSSNGWTTINEDGFDLTDRHIGRRSGNNDDGEHGGYIESDPSTEWQAGREYRVRLQMRRGGQSHCSRTNEAYAGGSSQSSVSMYFRVVE